MNTRLALTVAAWSVITILAASCGESTTNKTADETTPDSTYTALAVNYAQGAQKVLGKNLQTAIAEQGILGALSFCNIEALPLTDSMSTLYNTRLSRVSDRPRNMKNHASAEELTYIVNFQDQIAEGEVPHPLLIRDENLIAVYTPIVTNALCMTCHGVPGEDIQPEVVSAIDELYPADQAKGYSINQVRGMWKVQFDPTKKQARRNQGRLTTPIKTTPKR